MPKQTPKRTVQRKSSKTRTQTQPRERKEFKMSSVAVAYNQSARQTGRQTARYVESERIGIDLIGSIAFSTALASPCQPGLPGSFPWLSNHAILYEKYTVNKITYRYKSYKGTSTNGNVILSFDYNPMDQAPTSAVQAEQSTTFVSGAPWKTLDLVVTPMGGKTLFTRDVLPIGGDPKTYDYGTLFVSMTGCSDTTPHGYIEVIYDISFHGKQAVSVPGNLTSIRFLSVYNNAVGVVLPVVNVYQPMPAQQTPGNIEGCVWDAVHTQWLVPPGIYLMYIQCCSDDALGVLNTAEMAFIDDATSVVTKRLMTAVYATAGIGGGYRFNVQAVKILTVPTRLACEVDSTFGCTIPVGGAMMTLLQLST